MGFACCSVYSVDRVDDDRVDESGGVVVTILGRGNSNQ